MTRLGTIWTGLVERTARLRLLLAWVLPPLVLLAWGAGVAHTGRSPAGDGPHVLGTAMRLSQQLRGLDLGTFGWCYSSLLAPHPPGAYTPALLSYLVTGTTWSWAHLAAGALVIWATWDGVRRLAGGWAGAIWLAASPLVWLQAEAYGVDLVAAAAVVQAVSHLVASRELSVRRHVIGFGFWMGAAFLSKYTAPMFLWAPSLVAAWWVLRHRRWRALGLSLLVFLIVAGPWYLTHLHEVMGYLGANADQHNELVSNKAILRGSWTDPDRLAWYPAALLDAVGWPAALGLLLSALAWPRKPDTPAGTWLVPLLAVLGGWFLLNLQIQRQDRYLLAALPLLAALAGSSRLRWWLAPIGAVTAYGTAAMYFTWTEVPVVRAYTHDIHNAGGTWPWPHEAYRPTSAPPERWRLPEAITAMRAVYGSDDGTVGFLLDDAHGAPSFGLVLSQVASSGYRWDVATVMLRDRGAPATRYDDGANVFVGPFTTDDWPSRDFDTLLAIVRPGDERSAAWLSTTGMVADQTWPLGSGLRATVYHSETGPLRFSDPGR